MEHVETITLPNGLVLEVLDFSRLIARDTVHVRMAVRMDIIPEERFFENRRQWEDVRAVFGPVLRYEYRKERTFTPVEKSRAVFSELLEDFKKDILPYLGRPQFAERFCRARHREMEQHPERYDRFPGKAHSAAGEGDDDLDLASLLRKEEEKSRGGS